MGPLPHGALRATAQAGNRPVHLQGPGAVAWPDLLQGEGAPRALPPPFWSWYLRVFRSGDTLYWQQGLRGEARPVLAHLRDFSLVYRYRREGRGEALDNPAGRPAPYLVQGGGPSSWQRFSSTEGLRPPLGVRTGTSRRRQASFPPIPRNG